MHYRHGVFPIGFQWASHSFPRGCAYLARMVAQRLRKVAWSRGPSWPTSPSILIKDPKNKNNSGYRCHVFDSLKGLLPCLGPSSQSYTHAMLCDMSCTDSNVYLCIASRVRLHKMLAVAKQISADVAQLKKKGCMRLREPLLKMRLFIPDRFRRLRKVVRFEGKGCARCAKYL